MNYLLLILINLLSFNCFGSCAQFETALEKAIARVGVRQEKNALKSVWSGPEALEYKALYSKMDKSSANNVNFIARVDQEKIKKSGNTLYFNIENRFQKKLNDSVIQDKAMVDAFNNSILLKLNSSLPEFPLANKFLRAKAMGFKSEDLELFVQPAIKVKLQTELDQLYQRVNKEFAEELQQKGISKLISPRTDGVGDVSVWFLSGTGDSALKANIASRYARKMGFGNGNAHTVHFEDIEKFVFADMMEIEKIRRKLASSHALLKSGIMKEHPNGEIIPSRGMIDILRKVKPEECLDYADYVAKIRAKVKNQFGAKINEKDIDDLTAYFKTQDSLSPPIFSPERVEIDLGEAEHLIISVDFTGVGVKNAEAQMLALSRVDYNQVNKTTLIDEAFNKIEDGVGVVTAQMEKAKDYFTAGVRNKKDLNSAMQYTGDDGINMPRIHWTQKRKEELAEHLGNYEDPSMFRMTYTKPKTQNGVVVPKDQRSQLVVRSESIEKDLRADIVGLGGGKIPLERSVKFSLSVDFIPSAQGGKFNLIISGAKPTVAEKKLMEEAFKAQLNKEKGEVMGSIVDLSK